MFVYSWSLQNIENRFVKHLFCQPLVNHWFWSLWRNKSSLKRLPRENDIGQKEFFMIIFYHAWHMKYGNTHLNIFELIHITHTCMSYVHSHQYNEMNERNDYSDVAMSLLCTMRNFKLKVLRNKDYSNKVSTKKLRVLQTTRLHLN